MMNITISLLAGLTLFGVSACTEEKKARNSMDSQETIAVKTYQLLPTDESLSVTCTGMITTENEASYAFKIGGVIDRMYVKEGGFFKKGTLMASLKMDEVESGYTQAKLGFEKSGRDLRRVENLYRDSVATLEQLQNTQTAFEVARKQLESVAFDREYAYIYANTDGFVTKKMANEGEIVAGGAPVLAINENSGAGWVVRVGLSDRDWAATEIGNRAIIHLDAYPKKTLNGIVSRKSRAADPGSGSFEVEIKLDLGGLRPAVGMFAKATIQTNTVQQLQGIPYDALIEADGRNAFVFVPTSDGKVKRQAIEIAGFDNSEVKVKAGLEGVKEVVLTNSAFLNENSSIKIIK